MAFEGEGDGGGGGAGDASALLGGAGGGDAEAGGAGAGGDAGAGAGAGAGDGGFGAGGGDTGADAEWLGKLSAEGGDADNPSNRDWAKAAGVKDPDHAVKLLRDNMKAARDRGGLKVPGADAKPEEITAYRAAIGVPEKPDGYEIKGPEGVKLNDDLIGRLRESAVKHGAPKGAFEGLVGDFIQAQLDEAATETKRQDDLAAAKLKEWGGKRDEQVAHVNSAMRSLGLSSADGQALRGALGADRALDLLAKLGAGMAEDTLLTGGKGRFGVSPAEAQAEIDRLKADPEFVKKVAIKGSAERARWDRLNQAAAEGRARADAA